MSIYVDSFIATIDHQDRNIHQHTTCPSKSQHASILDPPPIRINNKTKPIKGSYGYPAQFQNPDDFSTTQMQLRTKESKTQIMITHKSPLSDVWSDMMLGYSDALNAVGVVGWFVLAYVPIATETEEGYKGKHVLKAKTNSARGIAKVVSSRSRISSVAGSEKSDWLDQRKELERKSLAMSRVRTTMSYHYLCFTFFCT